MRRVQDLAVSADPDAATWDRAAELAEVRLALVAAVEAAQSAAELRACLQVRTRAVAVCGPGAEAAYQRSAAVLDGSTEALALQVESADSTWGAAVEAWAGTGPRELVLAGNRIGDRGVAQVVDRQRVLVVARLVVQARRDEGAVRRERAAGVQGYHVPRDRRRGGAPEEHEEHGRVEALARVDFGRVYQYRERRRR